MVGLFVCGFLTQTRRGGKVNFVVPLLIELLGVIELPSSGLFFLVVSILGSVLSNPPRLYLFCGVVNVVGDINCGVTDADADAAAAAVAVVAVLLLPAVELLACSLETDYMPVVTS